MAQFWQEFIVGHPECSSNKNTTLYFVPFYTANHVNILPSPNGDNNIMSINVVINIYWCGEEKRGGRCRERDCVFWGKGREGKGGADYTNNSVKT